jgi:hypothetical protein
MHISAKYLKLSENLEIGHIPNVHHHDLSVKGLTTLKFKIHLIALYKKDKSMTFDLLVSNEFVSA